MKRSYYYAARIDPPSERGEVFEYFKAYSKKQIKKHIENNGWKVIEIYDPAEKPVHGIYYQDVTEVYDRGF
jgi:hypothetical protein